MAIRAYLYDANETDRQVDLTPEVVAALHDRQLLWVDLHAFDERELHSLITLLDLKRESAIGLGAPDRRPRMDNYGKYFQLTLKAIQEREAKYEIVDVNVVIGENFIVTAHALPVAFLDSFDRRIKGDSELGQLDAAAFLVSLLGWHITSFFRIIEQLEEKIDLLDARALRPRHGSDLLADLAKLRQRVAFVRRILTPHREVYGAMARPDFHILSSTDATVHYSLLNDRLERAIEAAENARELLLGAFDMFTTQTALRTNEAMKVLTLVSVVLLPATVIIGITGLLLKSPVDPSRSIGFWAMLASIGLIALATLALARLRRWI